MFFVKTYIDNSKQIKGLGLFAEENIKSNKIIYKQNKSLDLFIKNKELLKLDKIERDFIKHYGYKDKIKNIWHLSFDNIRFCNHSKTINNISQKTVKNQTLIISIKDIKKGEELFQDYSEFENLRKELRSI
ncbi:MAG: SET domain-containing protein-lysine N-methyltransferase [Candidatus Nomurabacteria bacterium]